MSTLDRWLGRAERALSSVASLLLLVTMLTVVADVALRYLFRAPLAWSYDLVSLYLMVGLFFFSLSDTLNHDEHVAVDILHKYMPVGLRRFNEALGCALGALLFAAIFWMGLGRTISAFRADEVSAGSIAWPMWVSVAAVAVGSGLMALRLAFRCLAQAASLVSGRSMIALPTPAGAPEAP